MTKTIDRADMYRRQLGGTNAALARCRQQVKELQEENRRLLEVGAKYRTRCEELEAALRAVGKD